MARIPRHKHHSRKSRSNWALMGAFVASATLVRAGRTGRGGRSRPATRITADCRAGRNARLARALPAQVASGDQRQLRFDMPAGPLRTVLAEIERLSGISITFTNTAIGDITSAGVSGVYTPARSRGARDRRHERHLARHGAQQHRARDPARVRIGRGHRRRAAAAPVFAEVRRSRSSKFRRRSK